MTYKIKIASVLFILIEKQKISSSKKLGTRLFGMIMIIVQTNTQLRIKLFWDKREPD